MDEEKTDSHSDLCAVILNNSIEKAVMLIFALIAPILLLPFLYGIIWYEKYGTDAKRTIINQLAASIRCQFHQRFTRRFSDGLLAP
jgi:hypothetical protein